MNAIYLSLSKKDLKERTRKLFKTLESCDVCPRKCHINRLKKERGTCRLGDKPVVSSFNPHFGEEKPLVGSFGSGTIFFTSCNLSCVYCQNYKISQLRIGEEITFKRLAEIMLSLQGLGCHNINLVSPTSHVPAIVKALMHAKDFGLKIPFVYNTNAYDSVKVLKLLDGVIDIYMPDTKYSDDEIALKYSGVPNFFETMKKAIREMYRQVGDLVVDKKGIAQRGLLVRHLVLPDNLSGSEKIFEFLSKEISPNTFLNIMAQYHPYHKAYEFPELSRRITKEEYQKAIKLAEKFGLERPYLY
jgi:putative pyruvate formate lyase activating enzyme